jgi:ribosome-binding protein aMBF1 (putative translation factor)
MTTLDTSYHQRRLDERLQDPEFRREYEASRRQVDQVDAVVRALDRLRVDTGLSKAELARRIGKNPAAVRRLFSAAANPELATVAAIAAVLDAEIKIVPNEPTRTSTWPRSRRATGVS